MSLLTDDQNATNKKFTLHLTNKNTSIYIMPLENTVDLKGLVITNQLFGKTLPLTKSIPQFMKNIMTIISREKINTLFFIGDIAYYQKEGGEKETKAIIEKFFAILEGIPLPVYVMGGPQNRKILYDMKYNKPGSNIHVVYDYMIKIKHPVPPQGTIPNVYITNDAMCTVPVKPDEVESYAYKLKTHFKHEIANEDFLLVGSCNGYSYNEESRFGSIKEFSPDNHRNGHAIISCDSDGFKINIIGK